MSKNSQTRDPIPADATLDELIEFWEAHSLADYEDILKEVEFEYVGPSRATIAQYLWNGITAEARRQDVTPETLVNMWLTERLNTVNPSTSMRQFTATAEGTTSPQGELLVLAEEKEEYRAGSDS